MYFHQEIQNYIHEERGLQQFPKNNDLYTEEGKFRTIYVFLGEISARVLVSSL
jgi:hypothetical protein